MTCYIYCRSYALDQSRIKIRRGPQTLHIAADSGIDSARRLGVVPDIWLGDFDSAAKSDLEGEEYASVPRITFPAKKDKTDYVLAAEYALERGYSELVVVGGLDGRLDHTLACAFSLERLHKMGARAVITNGYNRVSYLPSGGSAVVGREYDYVSLIPMRPAIYGVFMEGFEYPLANATLFIDDCLSVSNRVSGEAGRISIGEGTALIIECVDAFMS